MPLTVICLPGNPGDATICLRHTHHLYILDDQRTSHLGALGQRQGDIGRVGLAITRQGDPCLDTFQVQMRIARGDLGRRKLVHSNAEGTGKACLPQDFLAPVGGQRHGDGPAGAKARGKTGFRFQPTVEFGRIACEPGQVLAGTQLADQTRRMPGGARCQLLALQKHDVGPAKCCQMIGHRAAGNAAADDDDARLCRKVGHAAPGAKGRMVTR